MYISGDTEKVFCKKKKSPFGGSDVGKNMWQYIMFILFEWIEPVCQILLCTLCYYCWWYFCFEINMIITLYNYCLGISQGW